MAEASAFLLPGAPRPIVSPRGVARRCCTRRPSHGLLRWRSPRLPSFVMSSSSSQSSAANPAGDDDDEDDCTDASPPSVDAASASSSDGAPPLPDSEDDDGPPPPLDYSALAARIAALPTADEVVDGGTVHRFDTIEAEDAAGYAAAYRSAVSLYLLLVGDGRSGRGGGGSEGVGGADVYALAVGRDRVALVFATRNDAVLYGRMMLARGGDARHRRVRVAELQPDDVERLCESGGMRMGFVPAGSLSLSRGDWLSEVGEEGGDDGNDVLADGGMDEGEASALREKLNKLFETGGGGA
ncbi:hypothetical protein I4F81_002815 [Pyropia yezoensis]|uniref:Uncharacterized protein n=1 Tax=Pyropia yezoensis TaxID=2788 RepID=A0ACC3BS35_PYRYE|nr:hypothetical protein I4F81_002815 [Neopyropia yezoensis]